LSPALAAGMTGAGSLPAAGAAGGGGDTPDGLYYRGVQVGGQGNSAVCFPIRSPLPVLLPITTAGLYTFQQLVV
jgi:hypothetical protein